LVAPVETGWSSFLILVLWKAWCYKRRKLVAPVETARSSSLLLFHGRRGATREEVGSANYNNVVFFLFLVLL
jgi:hypothetical protein